MAAKTSQKILNLTRTTFTLFAVQASSLKRNFSATVNQRRLLQANAGQGKHVASHPQNTARFASKVCVDTCCVISVVSISLQRGRYSCHLHVLAEGYVLLKENARCYGSEAELASECVLMSRMILALGVEGHKL